MTTPSQSLSSVHNAMRILKQFTYDQPELGISELSIRLGLAKSTIYRLIKTLTENQFVEQNAKNQKYRLGIAAFELGFSVYHQMKLRTVAWPLVDKLMRTVRRTVHLAIYDHGGVIYLCKRSPDDEIETISKIGKRVPAYCTATGKILLAHQEQDELQRIMSLGLAPRTKKTIVDPYKLLDQLEQVRKQKYAVCLEEMKEGICTAAVPVYDDQERVIAAMSVAGTPAQFLPSQVQAYVKEMRVFSRLITERMDFE